MNGINFLNSFKKLLKKSNKPLQIQRRPFLVWLLGKMKVQDVNKRLKNYCSQTNIEYIKNNNIKKEHLGKKWLHLNKRENIIFANNLLKFLRSNFWDGEFLNSFVESEEYKSEKLDISSDDPCFSSFKICATEKYSSNHFCSFEYKFIEK